MPRSVIVTGGSRGIGAATARAVARQGHGVAIVFREGREAAAGVSRAIVEEGGSAICVQGDVASESDVERIFGEAQTHLGPLGALVNNAGVTGGTTTIANIKPEQILRVLSVNVVGAFLCTRAAIHRMGRSYGFEGGCIVNVSSRAAQTGAAGIGVHYAASKAAVDAMTLGMARELAAEGIRVNGVRPGLIETEIHAQRPAETFAALKRSVPLGRAGTAEEVAAAITWLLSDAASYVTGATIDVAGGA